MKKKKIRSIIHASRDDEGTHARTRLYDIYKYIYIYSSVQNCTKRYLNEQMKQNKHTNKVKKKRNK